MDAVILPFKRPARIIAARANASTLRAKLLDTIAQTVMKEFASCAWPILQDAIGAADQSLTRGESFFDAVEAAETIILAHHQCTGNQTLAEAITTQRQRRQDAFFQQAARVIHDRLKNRNIETHYALARARRVIEGGGTIGAALHHALGDDYEGGCA